MVCTLIFLRRCSDFIIIQKHIVPRLVCYAGSFLSGVGHNTNLQIFIQIFPVKNIALNHDLAVRVVCRRTIVSSPEMSCFDARHPNQKVHRNIAFLSAPLNMADLTSAKAGCFGNINKCAIGNLTDFRVEVMAAVHADAITGLHFVPASVLRGAGIRNRSPIARRKTDICKGLFQLALGDMHIPANDALIAIVAIRESNILTVDCGNKN